MQPITFYSLNKERPKARNTMNTIDTTRKYELCEQNGTPLGPRIKKFVEREMEAGRIIPTLGVSHHGELIGIICMSRILYYNNLVIYLHKYL